MISLFPQKYKKDMYFSFTAGDKWNAAKYLMKNRFVLFQKQIFI